MVRTAVRAGLVGTAVAGLAWLAAAPALGAPPVPEPGPVPQAPAVPAPKTVTVEMGSEAWYQLTRVNTCSSPAGCLPAEVPALPALPDLPVDPTVYPPDTLHVGWAGGVELARTYVKIDTSTLPQGATLLGGVLELPLLADPTSGTLLAESAGVKACLVAQPFEDGVAGSLAAAPEIDCSVSSPLTLEGTAFTVDLQPFVEAWKQGTTDHGIAITPFTSSSVQSAWAIALPGRNATGLPKIGATLDYVLAQAAVPPAVVAPAQPVTQPVAVNPPAQPPAVVNPPAQAPRAVAPAQQEVVKAAGATAFGWWVLAAGLVGLVAVVWVIRDPEPNVLVG